MQPKYGMFCEAAGSGRVLEQVHIPRGEVEWKDNMTRVTKGGK